MQRFGSTRSVDLQIRERTHNRILCFVHHASLYNLFQMKPTRCIPLLSIFISTSLTCFGQLCALWVAVWSAAADQTATHAE